MKNKIISMTTLYDLQSRDWGGRYNQFIQRLHQGHLNTHQLIPARIFPFNQATLNIMYVYGNLSFETNFVKSRL